MKVLQLSACLFTGLTIVGSLCIQQCSAQVNTPGSANTVPAPTVSSSPDKPAAHPSGTVYNYLRTWTPKQAFTNVANVTSGATISQVGMNTLYSDGFGRPIETVDWQASPAGTDLVTPQVYDPYGREAEKFLLYQSPSNNGSFKTNPFGEQANFYSSAYPSEQPAFQNEQYYYSLTQFEASPLNRVTGGYNAGNSWIGSSKGGQVSYLVNKQSDNIQLWTITSSPLTYTNKDVSTNIPTTTTVYGVGQLAKRLTVDVNGSQTIEYIDKDGLTVMKETQAGAAIAGAPYQNWLCTYYIYDDLGHQRFIIPPKAVAAMVAAGSWALTPDMINELCFRYEFDDRDRVVAKKEPGSGWQYFVYDQKDRLIYTQDANMGQKNQWLGTIYDNQDRVIETGILTYSAGLANLQAYVSANTGLVTMTGQALQGGYTPTEVPPTLDVPTRVAGQTQYLASGSIAFEDGFTSESGANFVAEIVNGGGSSNNGTTITLTADNPIPASGSFIPLSYAYYDSYVTAKTYNTSNNGLLSNGLSPNVVADPLPSSASIFTTGLKTSSKIRVIENANDLTQGAWLETGCFYDDKGRIIQRQADNYKGGIDYKTTRFDFSNKPVCTYVVQNNPATSPATTIGIRTNTDYDAIGRLQEIRKTINENTAQTRIIEYDQYDALGKLKRKKFGQKTDVNGNVKGISDPAGDNSDWLEINDYAYNIQGWLKGLNWDYATGPTSSQVNAANNRWFGLDLSYDWGFSSNQFNGSPGGVRWVSAGDGAERAYGYTYDLTSRLLAADFRQNFGSGTSPNWQTADPTPNSNFKIDYSVKLGNGSTPAYDANGNILQLQQQGLVLNTSQTIDNLTYTYENSQMGNKLRAVTDISGSAATLGDFTDNNTTADDYGYDLNGNVITDLNKRVAGATGVDQTSGGGIVYTFQNLPYQESLKNADGSAQGTVTYIYDAAGRRLEKRVNELASAANNTPATNTTTTYLGAFIYTNNALQYFLQEDGKVRPSTTNAIEPYAYDYLIKDHLMNTRVVLTDEQEVVWFPVATVEETPAASLTTEQVNFSMNTPDITFMDNNPLYVHAPGYGYDNNNGNPPFNPNPNSVTSNPSHYMYKLNGKTGDKTGLGITVKVMAGDQVNVWGKSYYHVDQPIDNTTNSIVATALNSFIASFAGTPLMSTAPHQATATALQNSPVTPPAISNYLSNKIPVPTTYPKAYINWILFDEQFRPVSKGTNSGFTAVGSTADAIESLTGTANITTSGYLYIYCSNESNIDVYFDNLQVEQQRGPLLEETHYYPFGLTMAGISSKALKTNYTANKYKLSGQFFDDDMNLNTYQMKHRTMDPQLGRFLQIDPVADKYCYNGTYNYAEDKVTMGTDKEGSEYLPMNSSWFQLSSTFSGMTWNSSVQLITGNLPSTFTTPDGVPTFTPGSVRVTTQGVVNSMVEGTQYFFPSNDIQQAPKWSWDQSTTDPTFTTGKALSPDPIKQDRIPDVTGAVAGISQEMGSWNSMFMNLGTWKAYGDMTDQTRAFDKAVTTESWFDASLAQTYPYSYTPAIKANITNFILDGTFPNSLDILSSTYKTDLETNLLTGYYGLQVLKGTDQSLIRQSTLDTYNEMLAEYYLLPYDGSKGYKFGLENLGLGTSPNPTVGQDMSGWTDPDPDMPGEGTGELQFIIGNSGGGGSEGGGGGDGSE